MGSLIKSPGGTIVTGGGYIAGRADLVAAAGARLTAPGVGLDAGAVPGDTLRLMFQGARARLPSGLGDRALLLACKGLVGLEQGCTSGVRCREEGCGCVSLQHKRGVNLRVVSFRRTCDAQCWPPCSAGGTLDSGGIWRLSQRSSPSKLNRAQRAAL